MVYTVLDVETANGLDKGSICSIGMVALEGLNIIDRFYSLVRPLTDFDRFNTKCHGLSACDVVDAPTFADLWPVVGEPLTSSVVVAYNARFDLYALEKALDNAHIPPPNICYFDALPIARSLLDADSYRLTNVANILGIEYNAHNALADAEAAALMLVAFMRDNGFRDLSQLLDLCGVPIEYTLRNNYVPELDLRNLDARPLGFAAPRAAIPETLCVSDRFLGKNVVITGDISGYTREDVVAIVRQLGGVRKTCVSKKTHFLIDGRQNPSALCAGASCSLKHQEAARLIAEGVPIEIIDEQEFLRFIAET